MQIINNQEELEKICKKLSSQAAIFMDTEFYRRRTYYAKLSIVQIATKEDKIIIDVLSGLNLKCLEALLMNKKIVKVFHAPDQDFSIFFHLFKKLPVNVFDTQIAAGVIGLDDIMGYGRLCKTLLHINLDKTMQTANWLERPLSKSLLEYAIKDVEYLIPLYRELTKSINDRNLWDAYNSRSAKLLNVNSYKMHPDKIIRKMNLHYKSKKFIANLAHFITLREECAQILDIPRNFCATDGELVELCEVLPTKKQDLFRLRVNSKPLSKNKFQVRLLELCSALRE